MDNGMKSGIGLEILNQECLVAIRTGEDLSVRFRQCLDVGYSRTIIIGLATNFLLIESLQRFYQYYGDELQVGPSEVLFN